MKHLRAQRKIINSLMIVLMAFWQIAQPLQAATFYWDTDGSTGTNDGATGTGLGGAGTWDTTTANWWNAAPLAAWPNLIADRALFTYAYPTTAGLVGVPTPLTVTVSSGISANQLSFLRSGYTLTGGDITLGGTTPGLYAQFGESVTISSQILGLAGLTKSGGGSIRLTGTNTYTGATNITGGTLIINSAAALGGTGTVTVTAGNGTPSNVSVLGFTGGSLLLDGSVGGFTLARDLNLEGRGPIGQNGAALLSIGNNTVSGVVATASSAQTPATFRSTRISSVNGTLTLSGTLNVLGTAGTTITTLGGGNQSGVGNYSLTGILSGTGTLEKSGSGTLFLNPSVTSGFAGRLRVSGSAASGQSTVRVTSLNDGANTTSVFGTANGTTTSAPIDMNGGILEIRSDASLNFGKNVYQRASSTIFVGPGVGGSGVNGTATFGSMSFEDNITNTFNSRNGYGVSFTTAPVNGGDNGSTITNNMGGTLSFTGNFWSNTDNAASRTMTIGGDGNTVINGNVIASSAAFNHNITKSGTGSLTITGTGSTLDGNLNVSAGAVVVTDFRSLNMHSAGTNTGSITLGNATTTPGHLIIGTATAATAAGLTTSNTILFNGTTNQNSIYANQAGVNPVILNGAITKIAGATTLNINLGGSNTADNILNTAIPATGTGGLTKVGAGTWVLNAANLYAGATNIQNGTLKLRATGTASDVIGSAAANTIVFSVQATAQTAGGTLEFRGDATGVTTETLGALTPTAGAGTVRLLGQGGFASNLTFTSLGATTAASSLNFVTTGANGGVITLTGQAATSATNLPGTANFLGHLYINGADFATINGSAQVVAPTYSGAGNFREAASALTGSFHNKLTGSFTNAAATVSSLVTNSQTLTMSGNLTVSTGGILQSGGTASILSDSATPRLILGGAAATNIAIRVDGGSDVLNIGSAANPVNIGSAQTGGLTKNGAGKLVFFGTNAQTGTVTINEGTIELNGTNARLAASAGVATVVRQNAFLDFNTAVAFAADPTVAALDGAGTIRNIGAANVTLVQTGAGTWAGSFNQTGSGVLSVSKLGTTGAPIWQGLSNYTGVTTIGGTTGSVTVDFLANGGQNSGIGASSNAASNLVFSGTTAGLIYRGSIIDGALTLGSRSATTDRLFTLSGSGATLTSDVTNNNAIIWSNNGAIVHGTNADRTLTLAGASTGDNTFNPQLTNSTGFVTSLSKTGAGQWNLGNTNNTYTGITTLGEGILALNHNGALPTNSPLLLAPTSATSVAVFQMSGTFDRNLAATATAGTGTVTFGGTIASTTGGVGFAAHSTALTVAIGGVGSPSALTWGSGGFVGTAFAQNLVLNSTTALSSVDFRNAIDFGTSQRTVNVLDNGNTGADFAILSGVLSGTGNGGLRKTGTGILNVTGANTYTGVTDHNAGTLIVTSLGNSTSTAGTGTSLGVSGIGTTFDNTNALTIGNAGTSGAIFVYAGAGEVSDRKIRLNNTTSTTAGVQIHADGSGPLILTNLVNDMAGGAKRLYLRGTSNAGNMITSQLSDNAGALELVIDSNATWILTNSANNFTGTTTVSGGALGIGHDTAIGGAIANSNGNIFAYGGDRTVSNTMTMNNNANWGFLGDYNLTFSNAVLGSSANSNTLFNSIVAGKALTFTGLVANGLTANRNFTVDGPGETIINGDFTTSTAFGVQIIKIGDGTLTLGGNGTVSNWNQVGTGIDVDRGTLKFITNNAINSTAGYAGVTLSPEIADGDTATVDLNGTTQTVNAFTGITDGTIIIDNTSAAAATFRFGANNSAVSFGSGIGTYAIQNTGAGALSLVKLGNTTANFVSGITLAHKGVTASEGGGVFNIASPVTATTGLRAIEGSALNLSGGLPNGNLVTSIEVGGGSTLSLLDGAGSKFANLTTLSLGNTGTGTVTLNLNVGDLSLAGDGLQTDTLTLLTGSTLNLGNTITFNMTDAGLNANQTYTLLNLVDGGLTAFGIGSLIQGATPGGFDSFTWNVTNNLVQLSTGNLIVGDLYWRGTTDTTWNANANNWSTDKAGTTPAASIPGQGSRVIFAYDGVGAGALTTSLEQNFKINSLVFEAGTTTPSSVTINPGLNAASRLEIAPSNPANGIAISTGGPAAVTIGANLKIGTNQTWNVVDSGTTLTLGGALFGEADVTKTGAGRVVLSGAADPTFNTGLTADFTITAGILEMTHAGALGTTALGNAANVVVNSGGVFYYNGAAGTVANNLTLGGGTLSAGTANQIYSGTVNVSADSLINLRDANSAVLTTTQRNITLSGVLSGAGKLTVDSINTASTGNQLTGTLTLSNASPSWSGGLDFIRGTVAATNVGALGTGPITAAFGRIQFATAGGTTFNLPGTQTLTVDGAGAVFELSVDASGSPVSDMTVNMNGAITLGSSTNANAALRIFTGADNLSVLNIKGGIVLANNASISVAGSATRLTTIDTVGISETGGARVLTINDDLGAWAQTNQNLTINVASTYTGGTILTDGKLRLGNKSALGTGALTFTLGTISASTNLTGANAVANAIDGAGAVVFDGNFDLELSGGVTLSAARTFTANGAAGADLTLSGAINAAGNTVTLDGTGTGFITGGITQSGTAADLAVNAGTWTLSGTPNIIADDVINTGATVVLNLNSTGVLTGLSGTSNGLYARTGATINLNAAEAYGSGLDFILLGDNSAGGATLNTNTFNITTPRLDLGQATSGFTASITGTGTVTVGTAINLYQGTISAGLAGAGAVLKAFGGTVTLSGNNSGLTGTTAARVDAGNLILDYTTSNTTKLLATTGLDMRGGTLTLNGNAGTTTSQTVASFTLGGGGANKIDVNSNGFATTLNLGAITRAALANDGTIRFELPLVGAITTTTANTNGILGGYATVTDTAGVTNFAANDGTNNIVAVTSTVQDSPLLWAAGQNITDSAGFSGSRQFMSINSLRFNANAASAVTVSSGGYFNLASGGVLMTNAAATGAHAISGGTLTSGTGELTFIQDSTGQGLTVSSMLTGGTGITKAGLGTLTLSGNNNYTGQTDIQAGTLVASGGNAIGDTSAVTLSDDQASTLQITGNETIGTLAGGNNTPGFVLGNVGIGVNRLTINQTGAATFLGSFDGGGTLIITGASTLTYSGTSSAFTGTLQIDQGQILMNGNNANFTGVTAIILNGSGSLRNDQTNNVLGDRINNSATITLNSTSAGEGLRFRNTDDGSRSETVGALTLGSGHNVITAESTEASANPFTGSWIFSSLTAVNNRATSLVRGTTLGSGTDDGRIMFTAAPTGGVGTTAGGAIGTTKNLIILPYLVGDVSASGLGNSFVTDTGATNGLRPLAAAEYDQDLAVLTAGNNTRYTTSTAITTLAAINSLVLDSGTAIALTAAPTGVLTIDSGGIIAAGAASHSIGSSITTLETASTRDYTVYVTSPAGSLTISSQLTSAAALVKSGAGSLILGAANTALTDAYLNQGTVEVADLDAIGGDTGGLVFAGGTLRLGTGFTDDISLRTVSFLRGGGTIDTNGISLSLTNAFGTGAGGFTKADSNLTPGNLTLSGASGIAGYTGTTTISGGRLILGSGVDNRLSTSGALSLSGAGGLQLGNGTGASNQTVSELSSASTNSLIVGGDAALSTLTVNQSTSTTYAGLIGGVGTNENKIGITKDGIGALTLSGTTLTYTGSTVVSGGTLNITGSAATPLATSGVTVASGSTLNLINGAGQTINLGAGTLSLGASGSDSSVLGLELGSTSAYDQIVTTAAASAANQVLFNLTGLAGFGVGTYDLLTASSGLTSGGATYALGVLSGSLGGVTLALTSSDTLVQLNATALTGDLYWRGAVSNSWATFSELLNTNFTTDVAGLINANGTPGASNNVIFSASSAALTGTSISTTLDSIVAVKSLSFTAAPTGVTSVTIASGAPSTSSLTITPSVATDGIVVASNAGAITISAPVVLGANQTWNVDGTGANSSSLTFTGGVTGAGTLTITSPGTGVVTLTGTGLSTYGGATAVNSGVLRAGAATSFSAASAHTIGAAGTLRLNGFANTIASLAGSLGAIVENGHASTAIALTVGDSTSTTFAGTLQNGGAGTFGITKVGTGTLTLSGTNNYSGSTQVNAGVLAITGSTSTGAASITVGNNAAGSRGRLTVGTGANLTLTTLFAGSNATAAGGIYQTDGGVTATAADGTNAGITLGNAAGAYGYYKISDGTLTANRLTIAGNGFAGATGVFEQTGGTSTFNVWTIVSQTGGTNALLDVSGGTLNSAGSFSFNHGSSSYAVANVRGTGTINRTAGSISLMQGNASSVNNVGILNLLTGGTIRTSTGGIVNGAGTGSSGNLSLLNFNGGTIVTNAASTSLVNISTTAHTASSGAYIYSGGLTVDTNGFNSTINGALLAPTGEGVSTIAVTSGGSGYIGAPLIKITGGTGVGATAVANMVDDGLGNGTFSIGSITITNPGTGYVNGDTLTLAFGDNTSAYTTQAVLGAVTFNGGNTSGGLVKAGNGTITLSGANTYTGGTTINLGTLALGAADVLANTGNVTINGGTFDAATFNDTVATVSLQSGSITGSTGVLTSTANFDLQSGTVNFTGAGGLGGSMNVNKTNAGTVTLTNNGLGSFANVVNVTAGTLAFSTATQLGNAAATNTLTVNGGTLSYTGAGAVSLAANQVVTLGASHGTLNATQSTGTITFAGGISGSSTGNLTKTGAGTVVISGTSSWNSGGSSVTVSDGTLQAGFGTSGIAALTVGATGNMNLTNNAAEILTLGTTAGALTISGGARFAFELGAGNVNPSLSIGDQIIVGTGGSALTSGGIITLDFLNLGGALTAGTFNLFSDLNGGGGLLTGGTTYALGTAPGGFNYTINQTANLVSLNVVNFVPIYWRGGADTSWSTLGAAPANWTTDVAGNTDALAVPGVADTVIFSSNPVAGAAVTTTLDGNFTIDGLQFRDNGNGVPVTSVTINPGISTPGTLTLAPSSTSGGIEVATNAGAVTIAAPVVANGASVTTQTWNVVGGGANGSSLTVSGNLTITDLINKTGAGSLTLGGANSGAGGITLTGGTLNINSTTALGTGTFTIGSGTVIDASSISITNANANVQTWNGNFGFTGTNSLDLGAGAVTLGGNVAILASLNTLTVGGVIDDGASTFGLTKVGAGTLTLNGANAYDGLTSLTDGILILNGDNSGAAGGLTMAAGTQLRIGHNNAGTTNAFGSGAFTINGGTLDNTSGTAITANGGNNVQAWNGNFTFTGTNSMNLGTGAVTLGASTQITTTANTLTVGGGIDDGVNTFNLTKAGSGTLSLGGVNTYGGATSIDAGTLAFAANQSLTAATNSLIFGTTGAIATTGTLDLTAASATFGGNMTAQTNSATANNITIGNAKVLEINGSVNIGASGMGTNNRLNVTGTGTAAWNVIGEGQTFRVGGSATVASTNTLDMSSLPTFTADLGVTGFFRVGSLDGGSVADTNLVLLAPTSTITANLVDIGAITTHSGTNTLTMGSGVTTINANTVSVGSTAARGNGAMNFSGASGSVIIRAADGVGRAALNVLNSSSNTGANLTSSMLLAGHNATLNLSTLTVGARSAATTFSGTGTFTFDSGTLDATTLVIGSRTGTTFTSGSVTGNVTLGANFTIGIVTMSTNSVALTAGSSTGDANSTLAISGGTNSINTVTMGVNTVAAGFATGSNTDATINITGGATTVNTAFTMGAQSSASNAATTVNTAISNLNISAGSLTLAGSTNLTMGQATLDAQNAATASISITGTGSLTVGGNIQYTDAALGTETNTVTLNGGTLDMTNGNIGGAGGIGAGAGIITFNAQAGTLRNLAQLNGGGVVAAATLNKTTAGILLMDTSNAYTGFTTVTAGVLQITNGGALGGTAQGTTVSATGAALEISGSITTQAEALALNGTGVSNGGALRSTSGTNTYAGNITLGAASRINADAGSLTLDVASGNAITSTNLDLTLGGAGNITVADAIALGTGGLTKDGAGTATLSAANTYTGKTIVNAGKLSISNENNLGTNPGSAAADQLTLNGGTLLTTANFTIDDANRGITVGAGGGTVETAVSTTATISSVITGGGAITKEGAGTLIFTAANTNTNTTTINAGVLGGTGTVDAGGSVIVNATVGGALIVASGGTLAPGTTGAGLFTIGGNLTVNTGGTLLMQLGGKTLNDADSIRGNETNLAGISAGIRSDWEGTNTLSDHDRIFSNDASAPVITGTLKIDPAFLNSYTPVYGDIFDLLDWTTLSNSITGSTSFDFSGISLGGELAFNTDLFASNGIIVVVPEPSRALFLMLGLLGLMLRRRRR
jgi:autotransporter-associated beta strand protein